MRRQCHLLCLTTRAPRAPNQPARSKTRRRQCQLLFLLIQSHLRKTWADGHIGLAAAMTGVKPPPSRAAPPEGEGHSLEPNSPAVPDPMESPMKRLLTTLVSGLKGLRKSPLGRRAQLGVESLEGRLVPSTTAITGMTQWAQQFPGPTQAQKLWINFDGKHNDGQNISAFVALPGQDRDTAIQDILYRVEEVFSPFNVQVLREKGDGNYSRNYGDTTVFVGGDYANQTTTRSNGLILLSKFAYSQTSFSYSDYASAIRGLDHVPNSDAYDLSFVDPMAYSPSGPFDKGANNATNWVNVEGDTGIAQGIAHEAGHTFGLAHVRTDKNYGTGPFVLDPTPLPTAATAATATAPAVPASANQGTIPDVMSYTDANLYFANATLPVTTFNNSGTGTAQDSREQPLSHLDFYVPQKIEIPINITTQNSFTYLQTVLGARASDGYDHATDPNTVDPSSTNLHAPPSIGPGSGINSPILGGGGTHGVLGRDGDFDAYKLATATVAQQYHINVVSNDILLTNPDVMVRDGNGNVLFFTHAPTGPAPASTSRAPPGRLTSSWWVTRTAPAAAPSRSP